MGTLPPIPIRSMVRPVVTDASGAGPFVLDAFLPVLARLGPGEIAAIVGPSRSGRTTTLRLLRAQLPGTTTLLDNATAKELARHRASSAPVVYAAETPFPVRHACVLFLQPWGPDQWIEYLLANHRDRCAAVMSRVQTATGVARLGGNAELWSLALDLMARDETLATPQQSLHAALRNRSARASLRGAHPLCDAMWMSARVASQLRAGRVHSLPEEPDPGLLDELAALVDDRLATALAGIAADHTRRRQGAALGVLSRAGRPWRPGPNASLDIRGAALPGTEWSGATISRLFAPRACLKRVCLRHARVIESNLSDADLRDADFGGAFFNAPTFERATLERADLSAATMPFACLAEARCAGVNAEGAGLGNARCIRTDFTGARLVRADFSFAELERVALDDADLSGASLDGAAIADVDFRSSLLHGVGMGGAQVDRSRFDAVEAEAVDANHGAFTNCDFTASTLRNARFERARLFGCGLADIDWESANLKDADLTGCTFHAGSSRSGLVFSPIASEGSRTGFYTDDFDDRTHKAPEEIRKANLCFADLRGCGCRHVDFYLVDLRRAQYTTAQAEWFRACGAILHDFT